MLSLPMLNAGVGTQPPITLSSRLSEKRFDPAQQQLLRTAGRLAASRLASGMGSANQPYFLSSEGASKATPSVQQPPEVSRCAPSSPGPEVGDACADSDTISKLTAALLPRAVASEMSDASRKFGGARNVASATVLETAKASSSGSSAATAAFVSPTPPASARSSSTVISSASSSAQTTLGTAVKVYHRSRPQTKPPTQANPEDEAQWDAEDNSRGKGTCGGRVLSSIAERVGAAGDGGELDSGSTSRTSGSDASSSASGVVRPPASASAAGSAALKWGSTGEDAEDSWEKDERRMLAEILASDEGGGERY